MKTNKVKSHFPLFDNKEYEFINAKKAEIAQSNLSLFKVMLIIYMAALPCIWGVLTFEIKSFYAPLNYVSAFAVFVHILLTLWVYFYSDKRTMSYRLTQNTISFFGLTIMVYASLLDIFVMSESGFVIFPPILIMLSMIYVYPRKRIYLRIVFYAAAYLAMMAIFNTQKSFIEIFLLIMTSLSISFIVVISISKVHLENYRNECLLAMNEKRYRQALRMSAMEIWEYSYAADTMICCVDYSITSYFRWVDIPESMLNHGLFREDHIKTVRDFFNAMKLGSPCVKPLVAPMQASNGTYKWISAIYNIVYNNTGRPDTAVFSVEDINEVKNREIELSEYAKRDSMTKLLNRGAFTKLVDEALVYDIKNECLSMLILIDIDRLKDINDSNGHAAGDYVIMEIARRMRDNFRESDYLGRLGGDEFGIFVRNISSRNVLTERARSLCSELSDFRNIENNFLASCSVGAAFSPECGKTFYELYLCADKALYNSKKNGKNQFSVYRKSDARL